MFPKNLRANLVGRHHMYPCDHSVTNSILWPGHGRLRKGAPGLPSDLSEPFRLHDYPLRLDRVER